jgi:hypothetical protein
MISKRLDTLKGHRNVSTMAFGAEAVDTQVPKDLRISDEV